MKILEYRYVNTDDVCDMNYNDGFCWSRVYEYPLVINTIKKYRSNFNLMVHNSSWGFEGVHIKFKNKLESEFVVVISSDIKPSKEANTTVYDITQPPMEGIKNKFDVVINVSTMEEVNDNHVSIFNNLFAQVAPGGLLICTFDIPGLQIDKFNEMFGQPIKDIGTRISGNTSRLKNSRYGDLNCGFFIIEK